MTLGEVLLSLIPLAAGAVIGLGSSYLTDRRKERLEREREHRREIADHQKEEATRETRWDTTLQVQAAALLTSGRYLRTLANRAQRTPGDAELVEQVEDEHARLRSSAEQVKLVGSPAVLDAVRLVVHHAYAVAAVGKGEPDPRADRYPGTTPDSRLHESLNALGVATRTQLRVKDPDYLAEDPLP